MVDGIGIRVPDAVISVERLENICLLSRDGCFRGQLNNLNVTQASECVYIRGSLPKYFRGDNVLPLTQEEFFESLRRIEMETGFDLKNSMVFQLETATTLPVKFAPVEYLSAWVSCPHMSKSTFGNGNTVAFLNGRRSFSGYDKGMEMMSQRLPDSFSGFYGLRLELKYKKNLKHVLGKQINAWDLGKSEIRKQMVKVWRDHYFSIKKRRVPILRIADMTPRDLEKALAAQGLRELGYDQIQGSISDCLFRKKLGKTAAARMRLKLRMIGEDSRVTSTEAITKEIDDKVAEAVGFELALEN